MVISMCYRFNPLHCVSSRIDLTSLGKNWLKEQDFMLDISTPRGVLTKFGDIIY